MFVFSSFVDSQREKQKQWEREAEEWSSGSPYRSKSDYRMYKPRPYDPLLVVGRMVGGFLIICAIITIFFTIGKGIHDREIEERNAFMAGKDCRMFNKGDYVRIQNGTYEDLNGVIVGGCNKGEDYQVKLDPDQKADISGDGEDNKVDVGNHIISVDSYKDIVQIEKK